MGNGVGLYDQIEVYDDPEFYHRLCFEIAKNPDIECNYPFTKMEGLPQIIEVVKGLGPLLLGLITLWVAYKKEKPKVLIRFQDGRIIEVNSTSIDELKIIAEEGEF